MVSLCVEGVDLNTPGTGGAPGTLVSLCVEGVDLNVFYIHYNQHKIRLPLRRGSGFKPIYAFIIISICKSPSA